MKLFGKKFKNVDENVAAISESELMSFKNRLETIMEKLEDCKEYSSSDREDNVKMARLLQYSVIEDVRSLTYLVDYYMKQAS